MLAHLLREYDASAVDQTQRQLPTIVLVLALCLAAVFACADGPPSEGNVALGRGVYVPAKWQTLRELSGHRVHVQERRIACTKCHTFSDSDVGPVTPARCAACHEDEARIEHATAQAAAKFGPGTTADCRSCHAFTLDGTGHPPPDAGDVLGFEPSDCTRCHQSAQGDLPAVTVHGSTTCTSCHHVHESTKPAPASCEECHADITTAHGGPSQGVVERCTTCHQHQHAEAKDAVGSCTDCHATHEPKVPQTALFADGHAECTACHRPHAFGKSETVACRTCHEDVHVLASTKVAAHQACTSCHAPHDVRGAPQQACVRCHSSVHPDHPVKGAAGTCVGCHDPHPTMGARAPLAKPCASCHPNALADHGFHSEIACQHCHEPHHFALDGADRTPCAGCHQGEVAHATALAGHASCEGCHRGLPHRPSSLKVGCESCHAGIVHAAREGHEKCLGCHEPHGGALQTPCGQCHKAELASAPRGHQTCTGCHDPHTGSPAAKPCETCHEKEAASAHGLIRRGLPRVPPPARPRGSRSAQGVHELPRRSEPCPAFTAR